MESNKFLFEVSWEVCNKVGGIYTVITSKIREVQKEFGVNYFLIGPLLESNPDFIEDNSIELANIRHKLESSGITAKTGRWDISEKPVVILVNYTNTVNKDKLLYELWEDFGVDSMTGGWDYTEPVLFATVAGMAIEAISELFESDNITAHFHEWLTGAGLLYLNKKAPNIATVFTTHATILGRSMAGSGIDIYQQEDEINPFIEAAKLNITAKYSLERISAREADCFTTVSNITAIEARKLLKTDPDVILPNGFDLHDIPEFQNNPDYFLNNKKKLISFASSFLQKEFDINKTFIISTSGRYEFHNKGTDVLLDALGDLKKQGGIISDKNIIVFLFIPAGIEHKPEVNNDSTADKQIYNRYSFISTHALLNPGNDAISNSCKKNNLVNNPDDNINIIFIPVYLDGHDGILNMTYYEALAGCDLTVYPSFYEPWGYTPLESVAFSVPTITTDLAGFGNWVMSLGLKTKAVKIIIRTGNSRENIISNLKSCIADNIGLSPEVFNKLREDARQIAGKAKWEIFYKNYRQAYEIAWRKHKSRLAGLNVKEREVSEVYNFRGTDSTKPRLRNFTVKSSIPKEIEGLRKLAYNLWWSWTPAAHSLFSRLDPELYGKLGNNPVSFLETISHDRLVEISQNESYINLYESLMTKFENYLKAPKYLLNNNGNITSVRPVAYFSMEFGLHESLPIYSGGLGILSGDHMKSASDVNLQIIGIGLIYKKGYFKQGIAKDGSQQVEFYFNDFYRMPLEEVQKNGKALEIPVDLPGRIVYAKIWKINVGRLPVYLLDTSIVKNSPADREITNMLYGGGKKVRIEQEIILGIGGVKLLQELNINPSVYHINEGHSAFLIIQRLINHVRYNKLDFDTAREVIRASTVFTTHTPVAAGNESFDSTLVENYLRSYVEKNGLNWQDIFELGHINASETGTYEMTVLALRNSLKRNGVSKLHSLISRKMWSNVWNSLLMEEIPIISITNAIHVGSWLSTEIKALFDKYCSLDFSEDLLNKENWNKINSIPDKELWFTHMNLKNKFFNYIKEKINSHWTREGEDPGLIDNFLNSVSPSALTIGFGRRFATYKRATLLFKDFERFRKIVTNKKYPVQFIFAGKAHPDDLEGAKLIKEIVNISRQSEFLGKVIFLENYDISLARKMVSGVDLWLNSPVRPFEASGTSGMKAGINGVLNCSIMDGWWDEGYNGQNGWAFGEKKQYKNIETQDIIDSDSLYDILESQIIPDYYACGYNGIPDRWVRVMKNSIISIITEYNTHRMLKEYTEKMYEPAAKCYVNLSKNNFSLAKEINEWKKSIQSRFLTIHIEEISVKGSHGNDLNVNDMIEANLIVEKGKVNKEEIFAQMIVLPDQSEDSIVYTGKNQYFDETVGYIPMKLIKENDNSLTYHCCYKVTRAGKFNYGIRLKPYHPEIEDITDMNLVIWA